MKGLLGPSSLGAAFRISETGTNLWVVDFRARWASLPVVHAEHGSGCFCDDSFKRP